MAPSKESVDTALELARDELSGLLEETRKAAAAAYERGEERTFYRLDRQRRDLEGLLGELDGLLKKWRALGRRTKGKKTSGRPRRGEVLPEKEYVFPILEVLYGAGGKASVDEVMNGVYERVRDRLTEADLRELPSGGVRWRNRAMWVRQYLVNAGLLARGSPRGTWEITARGVEHLRRKDIKRTWALLMEAKRASSSRRETE